MEAVQRAERSQRRRAQIARTWVMSWALVLVLGWAPGVRPGPSELETAAARSTPPVAAPVGPVGLPAEADPSADVASSQAGPAPALAVTPREQAFLDAVNADRLASGLTPLAFNSILLPIARQRAAAQDGAPLSHFDAAGQVAVATLLSDAHIRFTLAGENLARSPGSDLSAVARLEQALMESPTHRANILDPSFTHLAVGEAEEAHPRGVAFAQIFLAAPR